jgi:O-antigen ligase
MENWYLALTNYALPSFSTLKDGEGVIWPSSMHAHNFYLQTWAEQGILGFVALIAIVMMGLVLGARYIRSTQGFRRAVVFGSFWSFSAYMIHSLVDSGPSSPGAIGLWIMLGLMVAADQPNQKQSRYSREYWIEGSASRDVGEEKLTILKNLTIPIMGGWEWFGLTFFLILLSLALIGSHTLFAVAAAIGAGLVFAKTSLVLYDTRSDRI